MSRRSNALPLGPSLGKRKGNQRLGRLGSSRLAVRPLYLYYTTPSHSCTKLFFPHLFLLVQNAGHCPSPRTRRAQARPLRRFALCLVCRPGWTPGPHSRYVAVLTHSPLWNSPGEAMDVVWDALGPATRPVALAAHMLLFSFICVGFGRNVHGISC